MSAYEQWVDQVTSPGDPWPTDRPSVSVRNVRSIPSATLVTHSVTDGDGRHEILPARNYLWATLHLAGVEIYGPLADLELIMAAAGEVLAETRRYGERLQVEQSVREFTDLVAPRSAVTDA